jgi:hypothetical protein
MKSSFPPFSVNIGLYEHRKSSKSIKQKILRLALDIPWVKTLPPYTRISGVISLSKWSLIDAEQISKSWLATRMKLIEETGSS